MQILLDDTGEDFLQLLRHAIASDTSMTYKGIEFCVNEIYIMIHKDTKRISATFELGMPNDEFTVGITETDE